MWCINGRFWMRNAWEEDSSAALIQLVLDLTSPVSSYSKGLQLKYPPFTIAVQQIEFCNLAVVLML